MKNNNFKNIKEGEFLSFTQYFKVVRKTASGIIVKDQYGDELEVTGVDLVESLYSAGQYTETIKASKHEMVEALQGAKDKVFTVCFTKADGSERILVGHLNSIESHLGRTQVVDLEVPVGDKTKGLRLVDNREIKWVVLAGKKYIAQ